MLVNLDGRVRLIGCLGLLIFNLQAQALFNFGLLAVIILSVILHCRASRVGYRFFWTALVYALLWQVISLSHTPLSIALALDLSRVLNGIFIMYLYGIGLTSLEITQSLSWPWSWMGKRNYARIFKAIYVVVESWFIFINQFSKAMSLARAYQISQLQQVFRFFLILSIDVLKSSLQGMRQLIAIAEIRLRGNQPLVLALVHAKPWRFAWQCCGCLLILGLLFVGNSLDFPWIPPGLR